MQNTNEFEKSVQTLIRKTSSNFKKSRMLLKNPRICLLFSIHLGVLKLEEVPQSCLNYYLLSTCYILFVDVLFEYSLEPKTGKYEPHNKDWVKEKIYVMLRKQAGK